MRTLTLFVITTILAISIVVVGKNGYSPMDNYINEVKKEETLPRIIKLEEFKEGASILVVRSDGDTLAYDGLNAKELSAIVNGK